MFRDWFKCGVFLFLFVSSSVACDDCIMGFRVERPAPRPVWRDGNTTMLLYRVITHAFPDATMVYRLVLQSPTITKELARGEMQAHSFSWMFQAKRLPGGEIVWLLGRKFCVVSRTGVQRCDRLPSVRCPGTISVGKYVVPNLRYLPVYRWLAFAKHPARARVAAILALERLGRAKLAWKAIHRRRLSSGAQGTLRLWWDGLLARLTGQSYTIHLLQKKLLRGGHCKRAIILASCVPEITRLYPKIKSSLVPPQRKHWGKVYERLHKRCLSIPAPKRVYEQ